MPLLFVSEYVCSGAWPGPTPEGSLRSEGEAMWRAAVADFARAPGVTVVSTRDSRLPPLHLAGVRVLECASPEQEQRRFTELAAKADATLVIAPEFDDLLARRSELVLESGGRLLGCRPDVIRRTGDKLQLARELIAAGIPTLPTHPLDLSDLPPRNAYPIVVKPRHGAGSINTYRVDSPAALQRLLASPFEVPELPPTIWQPYREGRSLSVSVLVRQTPRGPRCELFPIGEQQLSNDGRFRYQGGCIPADNVPQERIQTLVRRAVDLLGVGGDGYVGFDLLLPADDLTTPVLVEINPRLTTSYLGYRRSARRSIAEAWWSQDDLRTALEWIEEIVTFHPDDRDKSPP